MRFKTSVLLSLLLLATLPATAQTTADQILSEAQTQALGQHKNVFLIFSASWCGPCHQLDTFLQAPDMKAIVEKYFVIAKVHIDEDKHPERNTPGGDALLAKLTGKDPKMSGVPFLIFVDSQGKAIVNSDRPVTGQPTGENIGYPFAPEEIAWFMEMLKQGAPSMAAVEALQIETWFKKAART